MMRTIREATAMDAAVHGSDQGAHSSVWPHLPTDTHASVWQSPTATFDLPE
eukprot:CAMPEP_0118982492 /NCGR_PEP_ID=MMETSP1173-20130426/32951_1 /TAXON_ID=1034831 /ORGANISM="Rhizochromulina marina cf, Strain CCMP1243" /LENGTH=50 /DNA_ID=CAMNT_0006932991 /DNA_START=105 /DNA_END=254 /DNA_ORIENTATION=-